MPPTDEELYGPQIAALVSQFGEVPPPWAKYPRVHPCDIHWRMGSGEDYRYMFDTWDAASSWGEKDRAEFVRRWDPPYSWLEWVASFIWPADFGDEPTEPTDEHFARLAALGLGSKLDWQRCFEVEPDSYPLREDVSSRWIEPSPSEPG